MCRQFASLCLLIAVVTALVLSGCDTTTDGLESGSDLEPRRAQVPSPSTDQFMTYDDLLESVATSVPAFGGFYFQEGQQLVLVLTDLTQTSAALAAVNAVFDLEDINPTGNAIAVQGDYGFGELRTWYRALRTVWELEGVVETDIDEVRNRIVIKYLAPTTEDDVWEMVAGAGVPTSAVVVEVGDPVELLSSSPSVPSDLNDRFDSMEGGIQIDPDEGLICTLGFNATNTFVGVNGLVTNSHCTASSWTTSGSSVFYQPLDNVSSHRIGIELIDPPLEDQQSNPNCPPNELCRYSDSAFIRYDRGISYSLGIIARTEQLNSNGSIDPGDLDLGDSSIYQRYFDVIGESSMYAGLEVHKVGQRTGWTKGMVSNPCINRRGANRALLLCQTNITGMYAESGDSGSPVFVFIPGLVDEPQTVSLTGLLWGSAGLTIIVSPLSGVEKDLAGAPLGNLITH